METKLIAACLSSRQAWEKVKVYELFDDLTPISQVLWTFIDDYYSRDNNCTNCDLEIIQNNITRRYPKRKETFETFISELPEVSSKNVLKYIIEVRKDMIKDRMAAAISGKDDIILEKEIKNYSSLSIQEEESEEYEIYAGSDLSDIIENYESENRIKVYPLAINKKLNGGIPKNTSCNILIYADVECGKSLFAINMAYGFCRQGLKVLYIGNEEDHGKLRVRLTSRFASAKKEFWIENKIVENYKLAHKTALKFGFKNLIFVPLSPGTIKDFPKLYKKLDPSVIFIDQTRKILYPKVSEESEQLTKVSSYIRDFGKQNGIITVNICQANAKKANGSPVGLILRKSDVYMSNTTIPGDMDLMIGIGVNEEYENKNWRRISIPKNKLSGWHGDFPVKIIPEISKVVSL